MSAKDKKQPNINEAVYHVKGMHCPACEVLIEKKLLETEGISTAEASTSKGQVSIKHKGKAPSVQQLNKEFEEDGYVFSDSPLPDKSTFDHRGELLKITGALLLVGVLFIVLDRLGLSGLVRVDARSALPAFLLLGLVAGSSSCAALVGGIVLSMSKQWSDIYSSKDDLGTRLQPHLLFNAGRLVSYAVLGALLGLLGETLRLSASLAAGLVIVVSLLMIVLGLQMLGIRYLKRFQLTLPRNLTRYVSDEKNFQGRYMPVVMGALTFFLPCGFTLTAQSLALVSGSPLQGSLIMLFFALGTLPMLVLVGFSSVKFLEKPQFSNIFLKVAGAIVVFFAIYNINNQLVVLNATNAGDILHPAATETKAGTPDVDLPPLVDGKQVIKMEASADGYSPDSFRVRVGVPVRWEIKDTGTSGCTNAVIAQSLFEGQVSLTPGQTSIKEFTPTKPGKFRFSCWMGMVNGVIEVIDVRNNKDKRSDVDETKQTENKPG